jgi:hypothetical protein
MLGVPAETLALLNSCRDFEVLQSLRPRMLLPALVLSGRFLTVLTFKSSSSHKRGLVNRTICSSSHLPMLSFYGADDRNNEGEAISGMACVGEMRSIGRKPGAVALSPP